LCIFSKKLEDKKLLNVKKIVTWFLRLNSPTVKHEYPLSFNVELTKCVVYILVTDGLLEDFNVPIVDVFKNNSSLSNDLIVITLKPGLRCIFSLVNADCGVKNFKEIVVL
jgi:hypothetical protein